MPRRFPKRRTLVIAAVIVALSIGIVFASIPYLPKPTHRTIQGEVVRDIRGGNQSQPGVYSLTLRNISSTESFAIGVTVTDGTATICIIGESAFFSWVISNQSNAPQGVPFPLNSCFLHEETASDTLIFTPPSSGNWDVAAINTNPQKITVRYFAAP